MCSFVKLHLGLLDLTQPQYVKFGVVFVFPLSSHGRGLQQVAHQGEFDLKFYLWHD